MQILDWFIVVASLLGVILIAQYVKRYTESVADFLVANRTAGRYMLSIADGAAAVGAINILAYFEMYSTAGFNPIWWSMMTLPAGLIGVISGWLVYRFRETRALTLAQFFEIRYSKSFRVFAGTVCFLGGIINFGIFPAIAARFFIYFCGLPNSVSIGGIDISMFVLVMCFLLIVSIYFTTIGGQVVILITDFVQGSFCNLVFLIIIVLLMVKFGWSTIIDGLSFAPAGKSMIHPMQAGKVDDFNAWFFVIQTLGYFYWRLSWQGNQAYNSSAKSAHDSKMSRMLSTWRESVLYFAFFFIPICVFVILHHQNYQSVATEVNRTLNIISTDSANQLRIQMTVPIALSKILPMGVLGAFCAAMFAATISSFDTYLHSWGSIFVQDVLLPLRKKPLSQKSHLIVLRLSVLAVAIFVFFWSWIFRQQQHILMYMAVTGAVFLGGSGAAIIGGLYWRRGSTAGAWVAMIVGAVVAIGLFALQQIWPDYHAGQRFPIHGQYALGLSMLSGLITYVVVSLCGNTDFNLDQMLHRGEYSDETTGFVTPTGWKSLAITKEFSRTDKIVYVVTIGWSIIWWLIFVVFTIYNMVVDVRSESWAAFWRFRVWLQFVLAVVCFVWFLGFGLRDLRNMLKDLASAKRNMLDDGMVQDHKNSNELCNNDVFEDSSFAKDTVPQKSE